ncbi:uncharacterized protein VTP21DRAFT_4335 [Calcarisporiella thermophila]|uniref:uncharacterized protein n=1 Tax=Calcarisporiella thermophila TaxID=911321 RepID=UPI0037449B44
MDVSAALEAHKAKYKTIEVEKDIPLEFDLALLAAYDLNSLDEDRLRNQTEAYLKEYTRDGTQLLVNKIFSQPIISNDDGVLAQLPERTTVLPREKPLPQAKPLTRWEKFAKSKGIQKKKKERMVFDEATGEWKPQWGYGRANDDTKDWLIEVPGNADPMEDQYEKRKEAKKERIDKNKKRQRRNEEEAAAINKGLNPREERKKQLQASIAVSKLSTASMGKFDKKLEGEPKIKGVKRKFDPDVTDPNEEKEKSMSILSKVMGKRVR